ncbi:hypothetical protein D7V18_05215 [Stenotrophomonas maltophilia]|nr:hypothetical protein [Stenotrophomonas maltophilia]
MDGQLDSEPDAPTEDLGEFGGSGWYRRTRADLYAAATHLFAFQRERECERYFLLAAIRRTLSLEMAFRQAVDSKNGQMAMTIVRLNLDTLARTYALYWAEQTPGLTAEEFARRVASGVSIKDMKLRGAKEKASDRWLIDQIKPLADWIPDVYRRTSGAIHFSEFHIAQMLQQSKKKGAEGDGSVLIRLALGPTDEVRSPTRYREVSQAFLHITMMLIALLKHRCELAHLARQ